MAATIAVNSLNVTLHPFSPSDIASESWEKNCDVQDFLDFFRFKEDRCRGKAEQLVRRQPLEARYWTARVSSQK